MTASEHIAHLAAQGRYHFSTNEIAQFMGASLTAVRAALRRLKQKGLIATPYRGFHVIVAPEYRGIGCLPADQFIGQLMAHLGLPYYAALLSAARYHGAAHQQPQVFQVMVQKNRPPLECNSVRVTFVARRNMVDIPTVSFNSPRGLVLVSSPEATAFDLIGYAAHAGGLENVATVLAELSESIDPQKLASVASLSPTSWTQRLGYLFSLVGAGDHADVLSEQVPRSLHETILLDPRGSRSSGIRDARWKLLINVDVEPDL
ncbi:MAG: type IV toxin-antitoxin system AbiEi family antitoxin [bacterium]